MTKTVAERRESELNASIDPILLTQQLCEIESTTYREGEVGDFIEKYLLERGWDVEKTAVPQPVDGGQGPRWNIYASVSGIAPAVVFSTHMDTVPPYVPFTRDAEHLYGRGVCDAKGIMAAQIVAAHRLRAEGYAVGLLFVSGEERDSAGAKVANLNPKGSRYLINGEPTGNRLAIASKGSLRTQLRAAGKIAHSAYPELGDSAVHKLVEALQRLLKADWPVDEFAGDTTLNVGQICGGHAPNVIADEAEAQLLFRLVGDARPVREKILSLADGLAEVEFTLELPFVRLKTVEGLPTMIAKFTTDIPKLTNWGEPLLLGPGTIHVAHTLEERISIAELSGAVDIYRQLVRRLLQ
jgi:acetylornithine deacetylase